MTNHKEKITLTEAQETLLIPLYSKAREEFFVDPKAREILTLVDYDFAGLKVPRKTAVTLCIRANRLDAYARAFLAGHPDGMVIQLGCGLDSRCLRVQPGKAQWYDLDLPDVIALRRSFYPESASYHLIASSATDLRWLDQVPQRGLPVLVIAEGLLMYLEGDEIRALVLKLQEVFPGCELACDVFSTLTARNLKSHPSLKETGAVIRWGVDDPTRLESWGPGIRLKEEWYFSQAAEIARLDPLYRLMFKLAGLFAVANKAHRIVYYCL